MSKTAILRPIAPSQILPQSTPLATLKTPTVDSASLLAQIGSLGRIVALVANEGLAKVIYRPSEALYYFTPTSSSDISNERILIHGTPPFRSYPPSDADGDDKIIPSVMHHADFHSPLLTRLQRLSPSTSVWADVPNQTSLHADQFVSILRQWNSWDPALTSVFEERIRCSEKYLAAAYREDRPCPTLASPYIEWEQAIVEANGHPLHKCRMPVDPRTQPSEGFDFKKTQIAFVVVKRAALAIHGPLEDELAPLVSAAGIVSKEVCAEDEIVLPVHSFQAPFLLSQPKSELILRSLPHTIDALAQSSTRSLTVPSLSVPGLGIKLSLSMIIGDNIRIINSKSAFCSVAYHESGMLDPSRVSGLRKAGVEIMPEVAAANGMKDHLAVMIRWDPGHASRGKADQDVGYAVTGALCEPAKVGGKDCVAVKVWGLNTVAKRLDFLRSYIRLYFQAFLTPLLTNALLIDAHGQNSLLRYSRSTSALIGFSARDMSGTRFNRHHFLSSTKDIVPPEAMTPHDLSVEDLLTRAYFIFFVVHLGPFLTSLDLHRAGGAHFSSSDMIQGTAEKAELSDLEQGNGWAVVARELHKFLAAYEKDDGEGGQTGKELAGEARKLWLEAKTWPLQAFISQRMRADWKDRAKDDKDSHIPALNLIIDA